MTTQVFEIARLGAKGDGISQNGDIIPLSLAGETVRVDRQKDQWQLVEVLTASPHRIAPACGHYVACGGCQFQHMEMDFYRQFKRDSLKAVLAKSGFDVPLQPTIETPLRSRRRIGLHARKIGKSIILGFKGRKSWLVSDIDDCLIADPALWAQKDALKAIARFLFDHPKSAPVLHLTQSLTGLDIDISGIERSKSGELSADARMQMAEIAQSADFARISMGQDIIYQARIPVIEVGKARVGLPKGAFLQATPQAEAAMQNLVMAELENGMKAADLFCGVGTFALKMAEKATVLAADSTTEAIAALKAAQSTVCGLKPIQAEARDLYRRPYIASDLKGLDIIVFDPPRSGADVQSAEIAQSGVKKVIAISCNPQTFVRDAQNLTKGGYVMTRITPVDQFLFSSHMELVATFEKM